MQAHRNHGVAVRECFRNLQQRAGAVLQKQFLVEQVAASIARNTEFRENDKSRPVRGSNFRAPDDFLGIVGGIGHLQHRRNACETVKSEHNSARSL